MDRQDRTTPLPIIIDERMCSDTILCANRISADVYAISDIQVLNGKNVFASDFFEDRQQTVTNLLEAFHKPDLIALITLDDVPEGTPLRGYEWYDGFPGTYGIFVPIEE